MSVPVFLRFRHNHSVRGLPFVSPYFPYVANEVTLGITSNRVGLLSTRSTYTTNYDPGWLIRMASPLSNF